MVVSAEAVVAAVVVVDKPLNGGNSVETDNLFHSKNK
jgi:hypothetical protein